MTRPDIEAIEGRVLATDHAQRNRESHGEHIAITKLSDGREHRWCTRCSCGGDDLGEESCNERYWRNQAEHARQWYGTRLERLDQMAREEFPPELRHRYFSVVANGTADGMEPPSYAQQMNMLKHKLEAAIKVLKPFADAFMEVEASNTATDKDDPEYQKFLDQNTLTPAGVTMGHFRKALEFTRIWVHNDATEQVQSEMATMRATVARLEAKCRQQQQEMMAIQTELSRSVVQ